MPLHVRARIDRLEEWVPHRGVYGYARYRLAAIIDHDARQRQRGLQDDVGKNPFGAAGDNEWLIALPLARRRNVASGDFAVERYRYLARAYVARKGSVRARSGRDVIEGLAVLVPGLNRNPGPGDSLARLPGR